MAGEHAGPDGDGIQRVDQAEKGGPAAASAVLQPLPAFADDTLYIHDIRLHVYIYIHIQTYIYIYIYIYTTNIDTQITWSRFKCYVCIPSY